MHWLFSRSLPSLALVLLTGASEAATVAVDFTAELLRQRDARYVTGYKANGDYKYQRVEGAFSDYALGTLFTGQIELTGGDDAFAQLYKDGSATAWTSALVADCSLGPLACDGSGFSLSSQDGSIARATLFTDYGETRLDFVIGRRGDRLKVVQVLGAYGVLLDGERHYVAKFAIDRTDNVTARLSDSVSAVPIGPAAPLLVAGMAALAVFRRRAA
jgi:hypothetical protein